MHRAIVLIAVFGMSIQAQTAPPASPREQLNQFVAQLQASPNDDALRTKIVQLALTLDPKPAIPEEVDVLVGEGQYLVKSATTVADFSAAADAFAQASLLAPWEPQNYFNQGVALESAKQANKAIQAFRWYLLANPGAADASAVRQRIGALEAQATAEANAAAKTNEDAAASAARTQRRAQLLKNLTGYWQCVGVEGCDGKGVDAHIQLENGVLTGFAGAQFTKLQGVVATGGDRIPIAGSATQKEWSDSETSCNGPAVNHPMTGSISEDGSSITLNTSLAGYTTKGNKVYPLGPLFEPKITCTDITPLGASDVTIILTNGPRVESIGATIADNVNAVNTGDKAARSGQVKGCRNGQAGALVKEVVAGGPADQAGVKAGDVIIDYYGGLPICTAQGLAGTLSDIRPGAAFRLSVQRTEGGKTRVLKLAPTMGTAPAAIR